MGMFDLAKGSDDEKERDRIALSCYLNTSQCYIKSADALGVCTTTSEKDKAEMIYRKALRACDSALETDAQSIKALYRKAFCLERLGRSIRRVRCASRRWIQFRRDRTKRR